MKKEKKEKTLLSSDAVKFQRLKLGQWISLGLMLLCGIVSAVMTMYYSYRPGDFGTEMPRLLAFVFVGLTICFTIIFITFFLLTKRMLNNKKC